MIAVKPAIELIDPPAYGELLEKSSSGATSPSSSTAVSPSV